MDVIALTPEEFEQRKDWSFVRTVLGEGKVLYDRA
jgi:hypothetical protein